MKIYKKIVYFLQCLTTRFIKIGTTSLPARRLRDLAGQIPTPSKLLLAIDGDHRTERTLHRKFRFCHVKGEWFRNDPALISFIESNKTGNTYTPSNEVQKDQLESPGLLVERERKIREPTKKRQTWGTIISLKLSDEVYWEIKEIVAESPRTMKIPLTVNGWINRAIKRDLEHKARSRKKKKNLLTQENVTVS